jgi:hypothetical protein
MKMTFYPSRYRVFCVLMLAAGFDGTLCAHADSPSKAIFMSEMGAKATAEYEGPVTQERLRIVSTEAAEVIAVSNISTGEDRSAALSAGLSSGQISA